jgi:hypothetical protein
MGQCRELMKSVRVARCVRPPVSPMSWWVLAGGLLMAASASSAPIYTCIDSNGKKLTSDRPIPECATRDQRVLRPDGAVKEILPPTPTADERAEQEARERQAAADRAQLQDAIRRDRNLMVRFPNEAAHNKARAAALDDVRTAVQLSERRLAALAADRKPLMDEAEFFVGKPLPLKLKQQLDANDAATDAQRSLILNQQAEIGRITALFDLELARLKKLWAGAPAGSLGALPPTPAASGVKKAAK